MQLGVKIVVQHALHSIQAGAAAVRSTVTGHTIQAEADALVLVTDRISNDGLYYELKPAMENGRLKWLRVIGDAEAPNIIAQAVFAGHLAARDFDAEPVQGTPFKVERIAL